MKIQELEDLRKLPENKLQEELAEVTKELIKIKFEVKNGQSKSNHLIRLYRKYIARIKTLLSALPREKSTQTK